MIENTTDKTTSAKRGRGRPRGSKSKSKVVDSSPTPKESEESLSMDAQVLGALLGDPVFEALLEETINVEPMEAVVFSLLTGKQIKEPARPHRGRQVGSKNKPKRPRQLFELSLKTPWGTFALKLDGTS